MTFLESQKNSGHLVAILAVGEGGGEVVGGGRWGWGGGVWTDPHHSRHLGLILTFSAVPPQWQTRRLNESTPLAEPPPHSEVMKRSSGPAPRRVATVTVFGRTPRSARCQAPRISRRKQSQAALFAFKERHKKASV